MKPKWTKYCVLTSAGADNNGANSNNNIFTIKDIKIYVPVVNLSARDSQTLSELLRKGFERSIYRNEYKTKSDNKNMRNEYSYFLKPNFVAVTKLFVSAYSNQDVNFKRFKT